jgi:hypothetical protein
MTAYASLETVYAKQERRARARAVAAETIITLASALVVHASQRSAEAVEDGDLPGAIYHLMETLTWWDMTSRPPVNPTFCTHPDAWTVELGGDRWCWVCFTREGDR